MILDCDFCAKVSQFRDRPQAVEKDWNWQEGVVNKEKFTVAACPNCDVEKVKEEYEKKSENLEIISEPGEEKLPIDREEEGLQVYVE